MEVEIEVRQILCSKVDVISLWLSRFAATQERVRTQWAARWAAAAAGLSAAGIPD